MRRLSQFRVLCIYIILGSHHCFYDFVSKKLVKPSGFRIILFGQKIFLLLKFLFENSITTSIVFRKKTANGGRNKNFVNS